MASIAITVDHGHSYTTDRRANHKIVLSHQIMEMMDRLLHACIDKPNRRYEGKE